MCIKGPVTVTIDAGVRPGRPGVPGAGRGRDRPGRRGGRAVRLDGRRGRLLVGPRRLGDPRVRRHARRPRPAARPRARDSRPRGRAAGDARYERRVRRPASRAGGWCSTTRDGSGSMPRRTLARQQDDDRLPGRGTRHGHHQRRRLRCRPTTARRSRSSTASGVRARAPWRSEATAATPRVTPTTLFPLSTFSNQGKHREDRALGWPHRRRLLGVGRVLDEVDNGSLLLPEGTQAAAVVAPGASYGTGVCDQSSTECGVGTSERAAAAGLADDPVQRGRRREGGRDARG